MRYFDFVKPIGLIAILIVLCMMSPVRGADVDLAPVEGSHARWFLDDQKFLPVLDSSLTIARR
ncbi:MAG: hypothetical protein WAU88_15100, partial [Candidatus Zixiibacteriota bacterium]